MIMTNKNIDKYSPLFGSPFLVWVFMWVNAIDDVALYVDWPDCNFYRVDMLYKTHDLWSTLKKPSIDTRLYFSWVMPNKMITWYDDKIEHKLKFIEKNDSFKMWIITSMPVTSLLWIQYNSIFSDFKKPFIYVPSYTDKFRIDWYNILLKELSKNVELNTTKEKKKNNISLIWYLFDRNEWDCLWNINEIKRLLNALWVTINTIWLNGWSYDSLSEVENSELIVSLPYWKYASKTLSKRLWIDFIETSIPFGLINTIKFIEQIWLKLWIEESLIKDLIKNEITDLNKKKNILNNNIFEAKKLVYAWDPFLEEWIKDICNFLWLIHIKSYNYMWWKDWDKNDFKDNKLDIVVWNSDFDIEWLNYEKMEFGFPSYNKHYISERPYMWFLWLTNFIEDLYNQLANKKELWKK